MEDHSLETIASRCMRLNQLLLGKSNYDIPTKYLVHREGLLDILFALYEECSVEHLRRDKNISSFVEKFKKLMVELKSLRVNLRDFEVKKIIGRGHFGEVQVVREKATGDVYAMKVLHKQETLSQKNMAFFEEERDIMAKSASPWLTKLQYAFQDNQNLYLVMEFHPGGDMLSLLEKHDNVLPEEMCQFYLAELVLAINSLHTMGYVHRDIKPDNILIDRTGHIKLADFGSASKLNDNKQVTCSMPVGTPDYVAPEVLTAMNSGPTANKNYGVECDWWSLGIVAYEMVFGATPFADEKVLMTYNNIMNFKNSLKFPSEADDVSDELIDVIKNLLQAPDTRFRYDQLIVHSLFTDIDWNNIRHTPPPFVPSISGVDDTSCFDDFEPENRLFMSEIRSKKEFTGKDLPFVGFTYTSAFDTLVERLSSSVEESVIVSSCNSMTEVDAGQRKKEIAIMQQKIAELCEIEVSLKEQLKRQSRNSESNLTSLQKLKSENELLEKLHDDLQAEVKNLKLLLGYEREHRVITEKKAAHLVRCMKMRQRQYALRLQAKSQEFNNEENERLTVEEQLDEALGKIDECLKEKAELLEELMETKHELLDCQQKLQQEESLESSSDDGSTKNSCFNCTCANTQVSPDINRKLVSKLEKKNVELERDLEAALSSKNQLDLQVNALRETSAKFEKQIKQMKAETLATSLQSKDEKVTNSVKRYEKELEANRSLISDLQKKLLDKDETNSKLDNKILTLEAELEGCKKKLQLTESKLNEVNNSTQKNKSTESSDVNENQENVPWGRKSKNINEKHERILLTSDLKQENDYLKSKVDVLTMEVTKLKNDTNSTDSLLKQLKEKEDALAEAKLELRISGRKEQQTETISSSLRERNKELREKLKKEEDLVSEKSALLEEMKRKLDSSNKEVENLKNEISRKEKYYEIEKTKLEERLQNLRDSCKNTQDVNEKFVKTQGQYEELSRRNTELMKACEEKDKKMIVLSQENETLKSDLTTKQTESAKYKKLYEMLKSTCIEMEEQLEDLQIIVQARESTVAELTKEVERLEKQVKVLRLDLSNTNCGAQKEERQKEELLKHINELSAELDNQSKLHEVEIQNFQANLSHYKKVIDELEEQIAHFQKELSLQDKDAKGYSGKILGLESELCEIKEEAARHITQISSLKASNLKLTQALEEAVESQREAQKNITNLQNDLESNKATHYLEKVKLQETIAQQVKLIDFLQSKTETMEKKKRPNLTRFFGKKESVSTPSKDDEKLLETYKSRCRRLQDQLSQTRAEKMALQKEITTLSRHVPVNAEVPISPMSRAMHSALTSSPSTQSVDVGSPILTSNDLLGKIVKPPGMKHNIPHRFADTMCMRGTKCCACLDSIHFGRPLTKCQECLVTCHPKCSTSVPHTCGLPSEYMEHFKSAVQNCPSEASSQMTGRMEGWIKIPKQGSNKQGWERRYLCVIDNTLYIFDNAEEKDPEDSLAMFDFGSGDANINVTSAVSATELPYAATSDLPYVLKLECCPTTTCWPQRNLYIMTSNFQDKQRWVTILENLAEKNMSEPDDSQKNKLVEKTIWTLKNDNVIDPLCTCILDESVILLGAVEGLFVLKVVNRFTCCLLEKLEEYSCVYQISCMKKIGVLMLIHGEDRKLSYTDLNKFHYNVKSSSSLKLSLKPVADLKSCHLFAAEDSLLSETQYICVATTNNVILCQWDSEKRSFFSKRIFEVNEPCSCIHFTEKTVIFGADVFYECNLDNNNCKKFLDSADASLGGLVFGASQFRSFPVAIFEVSISSHKEYLLCFHEIGVFVNSEGRRTRTEDMKWSRLPLSFAYQCPYLFIMHFTSLEVIEIPPQNVQEVGLRAQMSVQNPQYMGLAHLQHSILIASAHDRTMELMLVDGSSIGNSGFTLQCSDDGNSIAQIATNSCGSSKGSLDESEAVDLDFSFTTSMDQSITQSEDMISVSSKVSSESSS